MSAHRRVPWLLVILALAFVALIWQYKAWIRDNESLVLACLTAVLVGSTATYTVLTYRILKSMDRVELTAHLTGSGLSSGLHIANLGATHILVLRGTARIEELAVSFLWLGITALAPGEEKTLDFRYPLLRELEKRGLPPQPPDHPKQNATGEVLPAHYHPPTMYVVEIILEWHALGRRQSDIRLKRGFLFKGSVDNCFVGSVSEARQQLHEVRRKKA